MAERMGEAEVDSSQEEEEGEMEILINDTNPNESTRRRLRDHRTSSFEIDEVNSGIRRGVWSRSRNYLLILAVCFPAVFVFVYFFVNAPTLFKLPTHVVIEAPTKRMREAELLSLYLLRNQYLGLLQLWNLTSASSSETSLPQSPPRLPVQNSIVSFNSSPGTGGNQKRNDLFPPSSRVVSTEEFRSALMEQIKLNTEIVKVLLSSRQGLNLSSHGSGSNVVPSFSDMGVDTCRKRENPLSKRTLDWKPKKNRFLLTVCVLGQMPNHLICLEKHMLFAALLNRVLVLPSHKFDYQYAKVIDINHINDCFGRKVVTSFEEFSNLKKNKMRIDKFICYIANPLCYVDEEHEKRLKALGLSLPRLEAAWPEDAKSQKQKKRIAGDITSRFAYDVEVLAVGDVFYAEVEEDWMTQPGGPLSHKCKTVIQPSRIITHTAERFIQTFLGSNFIALHFRRHGFLKFCNAKRESCFFPIPQAADCILRVVVKATAPVIYLSTDAAKGETDLLQSLVVVKDKVVPLVRRPSHTSLEKWDALLYRNHLSSDSQVLAMLDKTICAMSNVFIGSSGSTFTDDIFRLRKDWGSASVCDEYMCQDQLPNFVASQE